MGSLRNFRKSGDQQDQLGVLLETVIDAEVIEQQKLCNIPPATDILYDSRGGRKLSAKDIEIIEVPEQRFYLPVLTEIPGLSFKQQSNRKSDDYFKSLQNLLTGKLARCENTVIWHDIINNTLSEHPFKKTPAVSSQALVETLKTIRNMVSAIVYCQRVGTPDANHDIKKARIPVISVKKILVSKRKQKDKVFGFKYSAIHQNSLLEPKSLNIVLKNAADLKNIKRKTRTKNTRVSQKKRRARQRAGAQ